MGTHSPRGHKELDTTEQLTHTHTHTRRTSGKGNMTKPTVCVVSGMKILGQTIRSLVTQEEKLHGTAEVKRSFSLGLISGGTCSFKKKNGEEVNKIEQCSQIS